MRPILQVMAALILFSGEAFGQPDESQLIAALRQLRAECALPAVPRDQQLIVAGSVDAQQATNLVFEGASSEAELVQVEVEKGAKPLTLALAAQRDLIWEIRGDTKALQRVIVLTNAYANQTGVLGIAREKIAFADVTACHGVSWRGLIDDYAQNPRQWLNLGVFFGRRPDQVIAAHEAMTLRLPSGRIDAIRQAERSGVLFEESGRSSFERWRVEFGPNGARIVGRVAGPPLSAEEQEIREVLDSYPGGIRKLDPASIVAPLPVRASARYDDLFK